MHCQIGHTGVILLLAALSVFLSMLHVDSQNIDESPQHASVEVGNTVTLTCRVSGDVTGNHLEWVEYISSSTGKRIFTTKNGIISDPSKYEIEGTYNLRIKNVALEDGGEYACKLVDDGKHNSADVVVISKPLPIVPTMVEGENVTISCDVNYGSRPLSELAPQHEPKLKAYVDGNLINNAQESLTENGYSTLKLIMNYIANSADNDKDLTCEVSTQSPSYKGYGTKTIDVLFVVKDIVFAPQNAKYFVGEHINCTASGNPKPEYTWVTVSSNGPGTQSGSTLTMYENMIGDNTWKCRASNNVNDTVVIEEVYGPFEVVQPGHSSITDETTSPQVQPGNSSITDETTSPQVGGSTEIQVTGNYVFLGISLLYIIN